MRTWYPINTYRLQLSHTFTFEELYNKLPYLQKSGIDTVYLSPPFRTEKKGANFYKIVSFDEMDASLKPAFFVKTARFLRQHKMHCLIDFVPNHMGLSEENPWIEDILEHGKKSPFLSAFDIFFEEKGPLQKIHRDINYRRFFDICDLIALRVEDPAVFERVHRFLFQLIRVKAVHGVRIDHPDGLRDPEGYFNTLSRVVPYITSEKILQFDEPLPDWSVAGTVGYDTLNWINCLLVSPSKIDRMEKLYRAFTGETKTPQEILRKAKMDVMNRYLIAEVTRFARRAKHFFPLPYREIRHQLSLFLAAMPVYRTYSPSRRHVLHTALGACTLSFRQAFLENMKKPLFLQEVMAPMQQIMPGVFAKGYEDTYLYRYFPLSSLNEVGSDIRYKAMSIPTFVRKVRERQRRSPFSMNTLSTHDTKRSLDVRMRIHALLAHPKDFQKLLLEAKNLAGKTPPKMVYLLVQTLIGPFGSKNLVFRLKRYMLKAMREGKEYSDWMKPGRKAEEEMLRCIDRLLKHKPFWKIFIPLHETTSREGFYASLAATVIKAFLPGTMDHYDGEEVVYLRLVDPDNRDLSVLKSLTEEDRIKFRLTVRLWKLRRSHSALFRHGTFHMTRRKGGIVLKRRYRGRCVKFLLNVKEFCNTI